MEFKLIQEQERVVIQKDDKYRKDGKTIIAKREQNKWCALRGMDCLTQENWIELIKLVGENVYRSDGSKFTLFEANYNLTAEHL